MKVEEYQITLKNAGGIKEEIKKNQWSAEASIKKEFIIIRRILEMKENNLLKDIEQFC